MASYVKSDNRKTVVFLGTPAVVVPVLHRLLRAEDACKVIAVVTQPPARSTRGGRANQSPVHAAAIAAGVPVLHPDSARDADFLADLRALAPDLCITAAYGNVLPQEFLEIPKHGTLNIHPSLLPLYRGAAPVQRAVEEGLAETGVSIALTVLAMDAGPIAHQERAPIDPNVQAPRLLADLFELGAGRLVSILPSYFAGKIELTEQNSAVATKAKKIKADEAFLDAEAPLKSLHDKVRAFAGWPGTRLRLDIDGEPFELKVIETRLRQGQPVDVTQPALMLEAGHLCLRNRVSPTEGLELVCVQAPGKKPCSGRDFWNGMARRTVKVQ